LSHAKQITHILAPLAAGLIAGLALWGAADRALAEKVGVAAHVKPDAFSGGEQMRIGNSVFYNQRINTNTDGLVQVLLVDGSTFTVGPDSDLVIDSFVYDPPRGKAALVATFSKGALRFVGGKVSKNDGGVTIKTPPRHADRARRHLPAGTEQGAVPIRVRQLSVAAARRPRLYAERSRQHDRRFGRRRAGASNRRRKRRR
jgi:hypothetical protein